MSKKFWVGGCLGCLLVILLTVGLLGGLAYWGVNEAQSLVANIEASEKAINDLKTDFPWTPQTLEAPLDPLRYSHYVAARGQIATVVAKYPSMAAMLTAARTGTKPNLSAMQILSVVGEAPKALLDVTYALRAEGMSMEEFAHYSRLTLMTIKADADDGDAAMAKVWDDLMKSAANVDSTLAQSNSNNPPPSIEAFLADIDQGQLPEETKVEVREQMTTILQDPSLFLLESLLVLFNTRGF